LVHSAQAGKTRIQSLADRVAAIFVPIILVLGGVTFAAWYFFTCDLDRALLATIATIVIACPCAMGLATPTAITVAMGRAARMGILFTKAAALETARTITTVLFDKTGTLTTGSLEVTQILPTQNWGGGEGEKGRGGEQDFLRIAASIEQFSEHPLAKAIVARAVAEGVALYRPADFHSSPGGGVTAMVHRCRYAAGSANYIASLGVAIPSEPTLADGVTTIHLADLDDKKHLGVIALRDTLRSESAKMLQTLRDRGYHIGVLTGDSEPAAKAALQGLPIDFFRGNVKPEEKAAAITELKSKTKIAFVGDGINDGPALAVADLGIAIGGESGSDLAKAAGDVLLMNAQLSRIPEVLQLARHTLRIIKQNLFWAFAYNFAALPLAMSGLLSPGLAAAAMMLSSLSVVTNALRLYRVKL